MRCPKCGYISYDNVDTCLKCNKDISSSTSAFQGSTQNVPVPSFLKFEPSEADRELEGAAEVGGDIEFADPDLEILVDGDDDDDGIDFSMGDDDDDAGDDIALAEEFGDIESFGADDDEDDLDLSADLGQFEDVPEDEGGFSFADEDEDEAEGSEEVVAAMDIPEELEDISDLSPPGSEPPPLEVAEEEPEPAAALDMEEEEPEPAAALEAEEEEPEAPAVAAAEPEDDLDFSSLDMDFDTEETDEIPSEEFASPAQEAKSSESDMDEELNFDLDLGGLSIHDDLK